MAGGVSSPVIISVTIGAVLVLSVAFITIIRWARTKPSTQLPPPRPAFLSPYHQQRQSAYMGRGVPDIYDEERKLTAHGSGVFKPFGEYAASNASDSSLYRGTKTPYTDGDRTPNSGASFGHENNVLGTVHQPDNQSPQVRPNELGEVSLNSPNPPRQRPNSVQFVNGTSPIRPVSSFGSLAPNGSPFATAGGQAAATDPRQSSSSSSHLPQNVPPSSLSHHQPSPPRPFANSARSRHSIAGLPVQQPPPSFNQVKHDRRASRMSVYSNYSSSAHTFSYDHRRSSVNSMIRGPPHKSNMQIVLPQPLAPTAAGNGLAGSASNGNYYADDSAIRRNQRRNSRVDMWTETNNVARSKSPIVPLADLADGSRRNPRPSQGSEKSGRSLELPNGGHFQHMPPPPPLPAASSRSFLTSSRSGTPTSSSSALPAMSSAVTTPQPSANSSELVLEKRPGSSDAQSTSTSTNNAPATPAVDDSKPPPPPAQQQPQNDDVKPDNLPIIPPIETK